MSTDVGDQRIERLALHERKDARGGVEFLASQM